MGTNKDINVAIDEFTKNIRIILGEKLNQLILYGSYARGDYTPESDVDILVLVDMSDEEITDIFNEISDCAYEFLLNQEIDITPVIVNTNRFNYWNDTLPFYKNIKNEGVLLYA